MAFGHTYWVQLGNKKRLKISAFLIVVLASAVFADVKLRIYLRDGTLQAGNLVVENKKSFVLLTREGRVEIPKDQIMFVNGKALSAWEARPDKSYQSEILPSEIPKPAYVMDKAALEAQAQAARTASVPQASDPAVPDMEPASSFSADEAPAGATPANSVAAGNASGGASYTELPPAARAIVAAAGSGQRAVVGAAAPDPLETLSTALGKDEPPARPRKSRAARSRDAEAPAARKSPRASREKEEAAARERIRAREAERQEVLAEESHSGAVARGGTAAGLVPAPSAPDDVPAPVASVTGRRPVIEPVAPLSSIQPAARKSAVKKAAAEASAPPARRSARAAKKPPVPAVQSDEGHDLSREAMAAAEAKLAEAVAKDRKTAAAAAEPADSAPLAAEGFFATVKTRLSAMVGRVTSLWRSPATPIVSMPAPALSELYGAADQARPRYFTRPGYAAFHRQRADRFLAAGEKGRAIQELHIAVTLNRRDPETVLLLGKMYFQAGEPVLAAKYLGHPALNKREEARALRARLADDARRREYSRYALYGALPAGGFFSLILVAALRRLTRGRIRESDEQREFTYESANALALEAHHDELRKKAPVESIDDVVAEVERMAVATSEVMDAVAERRPAAEIPPMPKSPPETLVPPAPAPVHENPAMPPVSDVIQALQNRPRAPELPPAKPEAPLLPLPPNAGAAVPPPPPAPGKVPDATPDYAGVLAMARQVDDNLEAGHRHLAEGKADLARRAYRTALALRPDCINALLGLAYLCFQEGKWELALEHYTRSLEIDPNCADAHYGIGRVLVEVDRVEEAIPEFERTLTIDPGFDDARETLTTLGRAA